MLIKLAWRNIWRNRRRTLITAGAVMFAVFFTVLMESVQQGAWDHMLRNVVNFYYGYVQVQQRDYWDDQSLDHSLADTDSLRQAIGAMPGVAGITPRLESFALAAFDQQTTGVLVVGADPVAEDALTQLASRVVDGAYWSPADSLGGALVAEELARRLGVAPGDTLVLLSQGYRGANAAGKYVVAGLLHFGSPQLNQRMVYLPLPQAQYFFDAPGRATSLALQLPRSDLTTAVADGLRQQLDTTRYAVLTWQDMLPELLEARSLDAAGNRLVLMVLYLIIAFGIFGAIVMMTKEREREFGVLVGIGMARGSLAFMVWLEVTFIGLVGVVAGVALGFPLVYYFHLNPIDLSIMGEEAVKTYEKFGMEPVLPAAIHAGIFLWQGLIVLAVTTVLAVYPLWHILRLQPVRAMRA